MEKNQIIKQDVPYEQTVNTDIHSEKKIKL